MNNTPSVLYGAQESRFTGDFGSRRHGPRLRACHNFDKAVYDNFTEPMCTHINVGTGKELTIQELAKTKKLSQIGISKPKMLGNGKIKIL